MDLFQVIILSLLQGITEFLPVSSSAHLILTPRLLGWADQGLVFDVAVHVGTLTAVMFYFRADLLRMVSAGATMFFGNRAQMNGNGEINPDVRLAAMVLLATLPAMLIGAVFHDQISTAFRDPLLIAAATVVFGLALLAANRERSAAVNEFAIGWKIALLIGLAQTLAFIPGTSRSGITMLAAVLLGLRRDAAARFSFLLSIPVILGAGFFKTVLLVQTGIAIDWLALGLGVFLSASSALLCIHLFLGFIERIGFTPFVIYRLILGAVLLAIFV